MQESVFRRATSVLRPSNEPAPFAAELEPCVFYRVTPKAGPFIGVALMALTLIVVVGGAVAGNGIAWLALVAGLVTGVLCAALPRMAGRWPGSNTLTSWEIALERRVHGEAAASREG